MIRQFINTGKNALFLINKNSNNVLDNCIIVCSYFFNCFLETNSC